MFRGRKLHRKLCRYFKIHPILTIDREVKPSNGGFFHIPPGHKKYGEIVVSRKPKHSWKMLLVHEFAHALEYARHGYREHGHDRKFYKILLEVIAVAYLKPSYYKWEDDYRKIHVWAFQDGLVNYILNPVAAKKKKK